MTVAILITSVSGALITYYLHNNNIFDFATSSALPSFTFALVCKFLFLVYDHELLLVLPIVFFGASFIGMAKKSRLNNYFLVTISGLVFAFIYLYFSRSFKGFGGGLGTTAAISVLFSIALNEVYLITSKFIRSQDSKH